MNRKGFNERGQALILIALAAIGLFGFGALAIDGSAAFSDRSHAQNAADTAALDAALTKIRGGDWVQSGLERAEGNGYQNDGQSSTVHVHCPPEGGPYAGNNEYVEVIIESTVRTTFGRVIGVDEVHNRVEAVTRVEPPTRAPLYSGAAMVALKPHGRGAFRSHGTNATEVIGSGIFVNSDDNCAFDQQGNSEIATLAGIRIVGGACLHGSITPADAITPGAAAVPYPPENLPPEPTCTQNAVQSGNTLSPGNWDGNFPPGGVTNLQPGIYCVDGMFMVNAHDTLNGNGVTIFMRSGNVHWNGNAQINLTAPTSGPYDGLLIYLPMSNDEGMIINGNSDSSFVGTFLAPASDIQINGTAGVGGYRSQIVGYTIDLIGTADMRVEYNESENVIVDVPPMVELIN
ncbi:MAG: pilus assembly protein TadG-related protein [Anaerolineales bacterium]